MMAGDGSLTQIQQTSRLPPSIVVVVISVDMPPPYGCNRPRENRHERLQNRQKCGGKGMGDLRSIPAGVDVGHRRAATALYMPSRPTPYAASPPTSQIQKRRPPKDMRRRSCQLQKCCPGTRAMFQKNGRA